MIPMEPLACKPGSHRFQFSRWLGRVRKGRRCYCGERRAPKTVYLFDQIQYSFAGQDG